MSDSATVCGWLKAIIQKSHNVRTRSLSEVLIRRRLDTLRELIEEENLVVSVQYVRSAENLADALTRVPKAWLSENAACMSAAAVNTGKTVSLEAIQKIHEQCHFGVDRTLELAREKFGPEVSRRSARRVVSRCDECARIDPAVNIKWDHGAITAVDVSERWAADITHFRGKSYLSVIDVASGFTMWRVLRSEAAVEVVEKMRQLFADFGPPQQLMSDNGTVFRSREINKLLDEWDVRAEFSCAYRPQGNAVIERVHRTVKRTAARTAKTIEEACFWVNNTRGSREASPYEMMFGARARKPGVTTKRELIDRPKKSKQISKPVNVNYNNLDSNPFSVGELVYLKNPDARCDLEWSGPHRVTSIRSGVAVEIGDDGVPRHVSHLRRVPLRGEEYQDFDSESESSDEEGPRSTCTRKTQQLPRSLRDHHRPAWWDDYCM